MTLTTLSITAKRLLDDRLEIWVADVFDALAVLDDDSVDCVVTSPPYWGLRDYGVEGQLGLEKTLGEHLDVMVRLFREIRRVLKSTGTLWLNYGDCYATAPNGRSTADTKKAGNDDRTFRDKPFSTVGPIYGAESGKPFTPANGSKRKGGGNAPSGGSLKPKDLCMIPNRLAIKLQDDGWFVRAEVIWGKSNPMPESVKDRPHQAHEKIFLLTKSPRYFYDAQAVSVTASKKGTAKHLGAGRNSRIFVRRTPTGAPPGTKQPIPNGRRNLRNYELATPTVWRIATRAFAQAHFATFPPELAERCILAGCPKGGVVLDPFGGAGTTALVALRHHRRAILIELNPKYAAIAEERILKEWRADEPQPEFSQQKTEHGPLFEEVV